jgi:hypothetical protein
VDLFQSFRKVNFHPSQMIYPLNPGRISANMENPHEQNLKNPAISWEFLVDSYSKTSTK